MNRRVWRESIFPYLLLLACCILIGLALGASIARAGADPADPGQAYAEVNAVAVCLTIDTQPTVLGLIGVLQAVETVGHLTPGQAGEAVAWSVMWVCPIHQPLLREFVNAYRRPARVGVNV